MGHQRSVQLHQRARQTATGSVGQQSTACRPDRRTGLLKRHGTDQQSLSRRDMRGTDTNATRLDDGSFIRTAGLHHRTNGVRRPLHAVSGRASLARSCSIRLAVISAMSPPCTHVPVAPPCWQAPPFPGWADRPFTHTPTICCTTWVRKSWV